MTVSGIVREWRADEGWGVIDAPEAPGGCWAHFSSLAMTGFLELRAGQGVVMDVEQAEQDGYSFRALRVWP
ncbi:cold shock domain-containing protein [Tomitella fengzijianii]|uniref:Cold shock domain-containing protein n=1 Tax=Tomitella fengzijianii TaxID=2597660 RepID=A0A516WZ96_9ACTN|nr:cold shock domain-containing protein [Tomitella fengzijianii]QDQ96164.1 cold shock domain-containing protein [Tomitella fengzijianii]